MATKIALDVWLKFGDPDNTEEDAEYEANTFKRGGQFVVEWSHTAVGLLTPKFFDSYEEAQAWLTSEGFQDFSS